MDSKSLADKVLALERCQLRSNSNVTAHASRENAHRLPQVITKAIMLVLAEHNFVLPEEVVWARVITELYIKFLGLQEPREHERISTFIGGGEPLLRFSRMAKLVCIFPDLHIVLVQGLADRPRLWLQLEGTIQNRRIARKIRASLLAHARSLKGVPSVR